MDAYFFLKKEKSLLCKIYRYVWILRSKAATETSLLYLILFYNDLFSYILIFFFCIFIVFLLFFFLSDVIFLFFFFCFVFVVVVVFFFLFIVRCSSFHVKNLFAPLVFEESFDYFSGM